MAFKPLPIGVDDFEKLILNGYYYMETAARSAVRQIREQDYGRDLGRDGYSGVLCYGIAFYKKNCYIIKEYRILQ